MKRQQQTKSVAGFTLVELITAVAISSILILGVVSVYTTTKRANSLQNEFGKLQENARFAFQLLARDIRGAGFNGCVPTIRNFLNTTAPNYHPDLLPFGSGVTGWNFNGTNPNMTYNLTSLDPATAAAGSWTSPTVGNSALPASLAGRVVPGSDVIVLVQSQTIQGLRLSGTVNPPSTSSLSVTKDPDSFGLDKQIMMIGNCERSDVFQNSSAGGGSNALTRTTSGSPGNISAGSAPWSRQFTPESTDIVSLNPTAYYIGTGTSGEPALFQMNYGKNILGVATELVEGVENMQILYGIDTTTKEDYIPDRYVTANNIPNPNRIVAVRISLLMRTPRPLAGRPDNTATYLLAGAQAATGTTIDPPDDKYSRKVYTTTVFLRNKATLRTIN